MLRPSCGPGAAIPCSPHIVLGLTSKGSCCVLYLTEGRVVSLLVLLAPRLPLMIAPPSRPVALSTPQELTSTTTRQPTKCKCSPGLGRCLKERNIVSVMLFDWWGGLCPLIYWLIMTDSCHAMTYPKPVLGLKKKKREKTFKGCMFKCIFLKTAVYFHRYSICHASVLMFLLSLSASYTLMTTCTQAGMHNSL